MYVDPNGHIIFLPLILIGAAIGVAIGVGASIVSQSIEHGWSNINWGQVALDGFLGGVGGALMMTGMGAWAMAGVGAALGFVGSLGGHFINGGDFSNINWADVGISTAIGFAAGRIGGAGARNVEKLNIMVATKPTKEFLKAGASYAKVLDKIAAGGYKNLAGAAGARGITGRALTTAWNDMVAGHINELLTKALIKTGTSSILLNVSKNYVRNTTGLW